MAVATASNLNLSRPSQAFTVKSPLPPSPSTSTSMKLKTLLQTLILSHVCRLLRALSRAKSLLFQMFKENRHKGVFYPKQATKKQRKIFFGSFRLHYNWCSSHVVPIPAPTTAGAAAPCYESTWNSLFSMDSTQPEDCASGRAVDGDQDQPKLCGYLQWLEDQDRDEFYSCGDDQEIMNEIDRLADLFIASFHEKFRLEKVESYRRFQEMLARSL